MRLPQVIGPWRLVQRLGHGAFGSVYLAEIEGAEGFTSQVAVKILDAGAVESNPTIGQSLVDEAKLLSRLHHPGIVRVLQLQKISHEFLGETYAMAMEYVEGITLSDLLDNIGLQAAALNVDSIFSVLSDVTAALEYAHDHVGDQGEPLLIVHRDLKPANLIVTPEGHVKVLDFGIAWATERGVEATREGMTKGTLPYMSPEQVHGLPVDARSDLYSLGTILFEMLVGEPFVGFYPFGQSDIARMVKRVAELQFEHRKQLLRDTLQTHPHHLDELQAQGLEALLAKLLAREPVERFQSASELREEVESLYVFWRPEVGRRELAGRLTEWYASHPKPGSGETLSYSAEAQELYPPREKPPATLGEEPALKPAPPTGTETWHVPDEDSPGSPDIGSQATHPQPMPALQAAETAVMPTGAAAPEPPGAAPGPADHSGPTPFPDEPTKPFPPGDDPEAAAPPPASSSGLDGGPKKTSTPATGSGDSGGRPRRRKRRSKGKRSRGKEARRAPDSQRFRIALGGMVLLGLLLLLLAPREDPPPEPLEAPAETPAAPINQRLSDVQITGVKEPTAARTTVSFVSSKGEVVLAPVLSGLKNPDGLAVVRDAEGWLAWALVGTRAYGASKGILVLWDLRGGVPTEAWRLDDFFEETPEIGIGVHGATAYGFAGVDFLPSGSEIPEVLAVAHDRNFAPSWLLRISAAGEIVGRRYHPGHLWTVFPLGLETVVVSGVNNRLCPGGEVPCGQEGVVWVLPPPGPRERTEFLPGCGGSPVQPGARGYSWPRDRYTIRSVIPNSQETGGFELILARRETQGDRAGRGTPACTSRLLFGRRGGFEGQFSECGFEAPIVEIRPDAGGICGSWALLGREEQK